MENIRKSPKAMYWVSQFPCIKRQIELVEYLFRRLCQLKFLNIYIYIYSFVHCRDIHSCEQLSQFEVSKRLAVSQGDFVWTWPEGAMASCHTDGKYMMDSHHFSVLLYQH